MRLSARQLFTVILFIAVFMLAMRPVADPDFWWHLRTGQLIVETRAVPHTDPFSFTNSGKAWIAHEWLSEILIYGLYRLGGFWLLSLVFAAAITVAFIFVYLRSRARPYLAGFALLLGALATAPTWGVRPQMLSFLLSSLFLYLLDLYQKTRNIKYIWPLPLITLLWVNLHAGFALGLVIVAIYIAGDIFEYLKTKFIKSTQDTTTSFHRNWPLIEVFTVCLLAVAVNPNGMRMYFYPFETLTSQAMQKYIQEWFSPDFHQIEWQPLAWLILALIGAGLIGRKRIALTKTLLTLLFGYAALRSMRNVPLFVLMAIPVLVEEVDSVLRGRLNAVQKVQPKLVPPKWINPLILGFVALAAGLRSVSVFQEQSKVEREKFPAAAVDWIIQNHPAGKIYNTYGWGGYLIWRLPDYPVYIDGRADLYGDDFINDFIEIYRAEPGWDTSLIQAGVHLALVESDAPIATSLRQAQDWQVVYEDSQSIVFTSR